MTTKIPVSLRANILLFAIEGLVFLAAPAFAQAPPGAPPGGCTMPVSQRTAEVGCYLTATEVLGALQGPQSWHLYNYPTRAAAETAKGPHGTVVESFGKVWLYTIADANWRPAGGDRIAVIGPLPLAAGTDYTARYMEAVFTAGMNTPVHLHSGAEAWYLLSGAQCLETPDGITVLHAGESGLVPQGPSMRLSSVGAEMRRSVLLVLHDTSQPWITYESDWKPKGLCPK